MSFAVTGKWVIVGVDLCEVVSLDGVGEFMQELDEFGGGIPRQFSGQTDQWQIVGLQAHGECACRVFGDRDLALRAARSSASLSR